MKRSLTVGLVLMGFALYSNPVSAVMVGNGGFETIVPIVHDPAGLDIWFGNPGDMVIAENGIVPVEGTRMLKFLGVSGTVNIDQAIDASPYPAGSTVTLSVDVNRLPGSLTDFLISISAFDYALVPNDPQFTQEVGTHHIATAWHTVPTNTWTTLEISAIVPANTVTLAVELGFVNAGNIIGGYADNVQLIPEPSGLVLSLLGCVVGLAAWLRRR